MQTPEILYEDDQILVCHKPAGVPVQTKKIGTQDMESILKNYLFIHSSHHAGHKPPYLAVIHRLDQPVSGILVFARTPAAAKNLNQQLQNDQFEKYYQAVVCGVLPDSGTLTDYLVKDGRTNTSRICSKNTPGAKKAVLSYEILETSEVTGLSVVQIHLGTGRHHQIRVQLAHMGCPIVGDTKYNPSAPDAGNSSASGGIRRERSGQQDKQELMLCAYKLSFLHPRTKEKMCFVLP